MNVGILSITISCRTPMKHLPLQARRVSLGAHVSLECPELGLPCLFVSLGLALLAMQLLNLSENAGMSGWGHALDPQSQWKAASLCCLGCLDFCSQNLQCKAHRPHMPHVTHLHNPFYFCVVRRGRSPAMPFCLGTAKGKTREGWEDRGSRVPKSYEGGLVLFFCPCSPRGHSQSAAMAPAPVCSSGPGQALSRLNTTMAEVLRDRGAAVTRGDELSAQGWQHHPCGSWPGVGHSWFQPTEG